MASFANIQYRGYNGGWHNWSANNTNLYGAYAGTDSSKHCVVIALQTSSTYSGTSSSITITIPFVRQSKSATSGTFYIKWHGTTNPTGGTKPNPGSGTTKTVDWSSSDQQVHTVSATFSTSGITAASTWYYISIGSSKTIQVGYQGYDSYWGSSFTYWTPGTKPSNLKLSQTEGTNKLYFKGDRGVAGTSNNIKSSTIKYKIGNGNWQDISLGTTSGGSYSKYIDTNAANDGKTISAYVICEFDHHTEYNYSETNPKTATCQYYSAGVAGSVSISQVAGSNTVTFTVNTGTNGYSNDKTGSTLIYKIGSSGAEQTITCGTASSYTKTYTMTSSDNNKDFYAKVTTNFPLGDKTSDWCAAYRCYYYSPINTGSVAFTDNGDNSFSITGTRGTDGSNNKAAAATLYWTTTKNDAGKWTYTAEGNTQAFGTTGSGNTLVVNNTSTKYDIDIPTNSNQDQVIVAGAVVTSSKYNVNGIQSTDTGWITTGISLYKSPKSAPSEIALDYDKNRLTVKENWTLSWRAPEPGNNNSPICGYRIRIWVDGDTIPIKNTSGTVLSVESGTEANRHYYDTESTDTSFEISPIQHNFQPGNDIAFTIHAYSKNGKGEKMFSAVGSTGSWPVENAGIVRIKVGGTWKEGQVWIKTGGVWKEATSIHAKVAGVWKEST